MTNASITNARLKTLVIGSLVIGHSFCGGCVSTTTEIASKQDARAPKNIGRLFVVSQIASLDESWAQAFEKEMSAELKRYSVESAIQTRDPMAVQSDKAAYAAEIGKFLPDATLVVEPGDATVDRDGHPILQRFEAGLFRTPPGQRRRVLVWRATVTLKPDSYYIDARDMKTLAHDLAAKLAEDRILLVRKDSGRLPVVLP